MKALSRFLLFFILGALAASPALAALEKYKDWDKSPEFQYFATDEEKSAWKKVATDADAEAFVALFWARRDPDLKSPQNEFKARIEALVKAADQSFALRSRRGALTERGRVLIVLGPPKQVIPRDRTPASAAEGTGVGARITQYQFVYEDDHLPAWTDMKRIEVVVEVDTGRGSETLMDSGKLAALQKKAIQAALVHPELTAPPVYKTKEQAEAEAKASSAAAAEAAKGPALTPAVRTALEEALGKTSAGPLSVMSVGFRNGTTRLMVQVIVPAASVAAPETTKLAVLARDKEGKDAARVEEAAGLAKSKSDLYASRSLDVGPGEYEVAAALLDASGAVIASGRRALAVTAVPTEFGASTLFAAYNDVDGDPKKPDDPFTFSGRRFIARAEGKFDTKDGLSYAIRIYNPAVDPATKTTFLKRSLRVKPKSGSAIEVPGSEDKPLPVPEMKDPGVIVIDVAGAIVDENMGEYFRPGDYELRITITDGVSGKKLDAAAPFTLVASPKPAAPAPAPAKK
ncbi:MAG TPA: GWxTD domain-containing protein [Thermoanaerobaculia bacterium]|nr:GWxTD domain-containing protein [Thermoanaerobaculia bacterium]